MSKELLDAAMAVGDQKTSAAVIHKLGSDLEEANRIAQLASSPAQMGVELAKIAAQVSQPAPPVRVSSAPAPIPTIRGRVEPTVDDFAKAAEGDNDMSAYVAARKKAGDPFAMGRAERAAGGEGTLKAVTDLPIEESPFPLPRDWSFVQMAKPAQFGTRETRSTWTG